MNHPKRKLEAILIIGLLTLIACTEVIAMLLVVFGMSSNPVFTISTLVGLNCGLLKYSLRIIFTSRL
jgi:hypothetical protein